MKKKNINPYFYFIYPEKNILNREKHNSAQGIPHLLTPIPTAMKGETGVKLLFLLNCEYL